MKPAGLFILIGALLSILLDPIAAVIVGVGIIIAGIVLEE